MKRKRVSGGSAPAKKKAGLQRQNATVAMQIDRPQKSLRFQPNTIHGRNPEKKEITKANTQIALANGVVTFVAIAAANLLNGVVQGTSAETRIGRKIRMRSLDFRWTAATATTTNASGGNLRVLIVYDKQANAALATVAGILNTDDFHSPMNLANSDRFTVLRSFLTPTIGFGTSEGASTSGHEFIPMDLETIYNDGVAGTIADIQTGAVYVMVAQNGNIVTTGAPIFNFISRIRFDDN